MSCPAFGLRLDCDIDNGFRELHGLQDYRMLLVADGITGGGELEAYCCSDIAGVNLVKLHSLVCVHLKDTANTLLLALCCIQHIRACIHAFRSKHGRMPVFQRRDLP